MADIKQITLPILVEGVVQNITYDFKDATARQMITDLGHALYWVGVTETELTDGDTTNPIMVNSAAVTAGLGGVASYYGTEFVWNGSAWQEFGNNNLGDLAFKSSASADYTPAGSVTVTPAKEADTTASITPIASVGTLPVFSVADEVLTYTPGTLPTAGTAVDAVTAVGAITATAAFLGTQTTITVR